MVRFWANGKRMDKLYHRLVWEKANGRPLLPNESVHHKNGIRTDNRPENLEVVKRFHGAGQNIADIVKADTPESRQRCIDEAAMLLAAAGIQWTPPTLTPKP